MSSDHSPAFPKLQELLSHINTLSVVDRPTTQPTVAISSGDFPQLATMSLALHVPTEADDLGDEIEVEVETLETHGLFGSVVSQDSDHPVEALAQPQWDEAGWEQRGVGMVVGGVGLIILAIYLACVAALAWALCLGSEGSDASWLRCLASAKTWFFGMFAGGLAILGLGSLRRRRWSVPLIHAAGWLVAISTLMALAALSAGFFFVVPEGNQMDKPMLGKIGWGLLGTGVFGVAVPLGFIAIYQRKKLSFFCRKADATERWTDPLSEPLLMLWQCCLLLAAALGSLLFLHGAFPFFGSMAVGTLGNICTLVSMGGCFTAALLLQRQKRLGWWLAAFLMVALTVSFVWTFLTVPWPQVCAAWGRPLGDETAVSLPSKLAALFAGAVFAPLSMVLLMSRSSFPVPEDEFLSESNLPESQS